MDGKDLGRRFDCMCADVADLEGVANALDWAEYRVGVCRTLVNATFQAFDDRGGGKDGSRQCMELVSAIDDILVTVAWQIERIQDGVSRIQAMPEGGAVDLDGGDEL